MNIFWFDTTDLAECARLHPDKALVKLMLEHCQLLASALAFYDENAKLLKLDGKPYKITHQNHPCGKWARASRHNFQSLCQLTLAMADEYTYRFGKPSSYRQVIQQALSQISLLPIIDTRDTFAVAINDFYLQCMLNDSVISPDELELIQKDKSAVPGAELVQRCYRSYMRYAKSHYASWPQERIPAFWPRQEGNGRLFCRIAKHQLPIAISADSQSIGYNRFELFEELWALNISLYEATGKSKISKQRLKQWFASCECKLGLTLAIEQHFSETIKKQKSTISKAHIELAQCKNAEDYRQFISQCLGAKVPTIKTITKWLEDDKPTDERVLEHITYWSEKL